MSEIDNFMDKSVLITGACGTIGSELTRQVMKTGAKRVLCIDNNETGLFFSNESYKSTDRYNCFLADVRDFEALKQRMQGIDIVLHSAALKHVGLCEDSPIQAIQTNIKGTQNIIDAALANDVERVVFTSSDKAVNPTSVMGTSKLMGERLMTAASLNNRNSKTIFSSVRFGNVLGSQGSVVPLFKRQIETNGPVTLTDHNMTRFVMTLKEAVELVLRSAFLAVGGEVFVTKMSIARIEDIATYMISTLGKGKEIELKQTGVKPGEKMYEELINDEEVRRTFDIGDFFVVLPALSGNYRDRYSISIGRQKATRAYNSAQDTAMSFAELTQYFDNREILESA